MTAAEILRAAAELVERPGAWTQGELARCESGQADHFDAPSAACWCAMGAVFHVAQKSCIWDSTVDARAALLRQIQPIESIAGWNDAPGRTAAEVACLMRRAAATLDADDHPVNCFEMCCLPTARDDGGETKEGIDG